MRLAKILLPVDFSEQTAGAAQYAKALTCRFRSELTIVHVFQMQNLMFSGEVGMPPGWYEDMRNESQRHLEEYCADEFRNMSVRRLLLDGDVAHALVDLAHKEHMDLIVMPTHGYGGFRRFLLGSVTAKLLHDADCPILTGVHLQQAALLEPVLSNNIVGGARMSRAPGSAQLLEPVFFRNIVCAVDFDSAGEKALRWASTFAAEFHSRLTVVHALPSTEVGQAHYFDQALPMRLREIAQEQIDQLLANVGTGADVILDPGTVVDVVRDAATSQKADLVVIGRHENPGLLGRLRTNAYKIVRESPCPVVSV